MADNVIELRPSYGAELVEAVASGVSDLEAEGGRITGYAFVIFGETSKRQPDAVQAFRVERLAEAVGEVTALQADILEALRSNKDHLPCPECDK